MRFRITSAAYAMLLVICYSAYFKPFGNALDAFSVLLCMLGLACVALWPHSEERRAARDSKERSGWADRIEIRPGDHGPGGGALPRPLLVAAPIILDCRSAELIGR